MGQLSAVAPNDYHRFSGVFRLINSYLDVRFRPN